jgi:hypothetical protein
MSKWGGDPVKPTYREMASAVQRAADEASRMAAMILTGEAIGPKPADIRLGAIDIGRQASCLTAAARELDATAKLIDGNTQTRRKAG